MLHTINYVGSSVGIVDVSARQRMCLRTRSIHKTTTATTPDHDDGYISHELHNGRVLHMKK